MASWSGIAAVTEHSSVLLSQAGYGTIKQNGLAGGLNTIGIVGTIVSAQVVDRPGRPVYLMGGSAGLFAVNLTAASFYESTINDPSMASTIASAAVTMLFLSILSTPPPRKHWHSSFPPRSSLQGCAPREITLASQDRPSV